MNTLQVNLLDVDVPLETVDSNLAGTRQLGTVYVSAGAGEMAIGVHLDLIAVETVDGIQRCVDPDHEEDYERVLALCGDGPLCTIKLPGLTYEYIVFAYPFAD